MGFALGPEHQVQPRPVRILLVEDDLLLQHLFGSALAWQGHEAEAASDGLDALWKVRKSRYDLMLCGYKLSELNGLAVARLTRNLAGMAACPALTGMPASLTNNEAMPGSASDEIVAKPVSLNKLVLIVQRYLDTREEGAAGRWRHGGGPGGLRRRAWFGTQPGGPTIAALHSAREG